MCIVIPCRKRHDAIVKPNDKLHNDQSYKETIQNQTAPYHQRPFQTLGLMDSREGNKIFRVVLVTICLQKRQKLRNRLRGGAVRTDGAVRRRRERGGAVCVVKQPANKKKNITPVTRFRQTKSRPGFVQQQIDIFLRCLTLCTHSRVPATKITHTTNGHASRSRKPAKANVSWKRKRTQWHRGFVEAARAIPNPYSYEDC